MNFKFLFALISLVVKWCWSFEPMPGTEVKLSSRRFSVFAELQALAGKVNIFIFWGQVAGYDYKDNYNAWVAFNYINLTASNEFELIFFTIKSLQKFYMIAHLLIMCRLAPKLISNITFLIKEQIRGFLKDKVTYIPNIPSGIKQYTTTLCGGGFRPKVYSVKITQRKNTTVQKQNWTLKSKNHNEAESVPWQ